MHTKTVLSVQKSQSGCSYTNLFVCNKYSFSMNISGGESQSCNTLVIPIRNFKRCKTTFTFVFVHIVRVRADELSHESYQEIQSQFEKYSYSAQLQKAPSIPFLAIINCGISSNTTLYFTPESTVNTMFNVHKNSFSNGK